MIECTNRELLVYTIARLLAGVRHVAVGMSLPRPAGEGARCFCAR
jgi:glutaconate CoA-transferase subunit B